MARKAVSKKKSDATSKASTKATKVEASSTPTRRSGRVQHSSPLKSKYFEHDSDNEDEKDEAYSDASEEEFKIQSSAEDSELDELDEELVTGRESDAEVSEEGEEEGKGGAGKGREKRKRANSVKTTSSKKSRNLKSRESTPEDFTPGGGVPVIHQKSLDFLTSLKKNNDRDWFHANDVYFRKAEKNFKAFAEVLGEKLMEKDPTVPELPMKDLIFRIYRDIRFSNDQTPYKTYLSIAWSRTGRKGPYAHYYLSIQPGQSFAGGGIWHPEAQPLARLRHDIDQNPKRLKRILTRDALFNEFLSGDQSDLEGEKIPKKEKAKKKAKPVSTASEGREEVAIRNFIARNSENALKTAPKGSCIIEAMAIFYDHAQYISKSEGISKDHKDIALLRLRNFTLGKRLSDEEICESDAVEKLAEIFGHMTPFITYLNDVVMPDLNAPLAGIDDSDNDAEEDEENEDE